MLRWQSLLLWPQRCVTSLSRSRERDAWHCHNLPTLYGTTGPFICPLVGISHNICSPQPFIPPRPCLARPGHEHVIITKPLQEIFVCVSSGNSPHWNKIVTIPQPLQTRCWSSSLCVWCYLRVPACDSWDLATAQSVINEASHKVKMRSFAAGKMLLIQQTAFVDSRNHSQW